MSDPTRRQLLAGLLGVLAQAAGTVVLASSVLPEPQTEGDGADAPPRPEDDLQGRADRVAADQGPLDEEEESEFESSRNGGDCGFRRGGFANGGGGGFRRGGFANGGYGGGGGFRRGGFANGGGGGGFRNGGFANGGGGGFRNSAFRNF